MIDNFANSSSPLQRLLSSMLHNIFAPSVCCNMPQFASSNVHALVSVLI